MARGDLTLFEEFANQLGSENHAFENGGDVFKLALIDNVITPTAADATPAWGATSGVDYDANEVDSTAGNYTANGETLANQSYDEVGGVATFDADDISLAQHASGFTNAYWGILYNDSQASKFAIGFVDMGGAVSEVAGPVNINWNASGIDTVTVTP